MKDGSVSRRAFLQTSTAAGLTMISGKVLAGPFRGHGQDGPIPVDKQLTKEWTQGLYDRGEPIRYRKWEEQQFVGMPIGGLGTGTVYLGGDGKLWCWDIFNEPHDGVIPNAIDDDKELADLFGGGVRSVHGANFVRPKGQWSPWNLDQGFELFVGGRLFPLDHNGFSQIEFTAEYPMASVTYAAPKCPVKVKLEAFTPFVPLDEDRSSYPAAVMRYKVTNTSAETLRELAIIGRVENPALKYLGDNESVQRGWQVAKNRGSAGIIGMAEVLPEPAGGRPDVPFDDFERDDWAPWVAEGKSFEGGPFHTSQLAQYQDVSGQSGDAFVNAHNTRVEKGGVGPVDDLTGTLTSPEFRIDRKYINMRVAGGDRIKDCFVEVLVEGKSVARATGKNANQFRPVSFDMREHQGKMAQIRIVDQGKGSWGIILVDEITFADRRTDMVAINQRSDFGSIALFGVGKNANPNVEEVKRGEKTVELGSLMQVIDELKPGQTKEVVFVLAWHFPNVRVHMVPAEESRRWYASKFADAGAVATDVCRNISALTKQTRLWRDTWYDSTLPHWFLMRTMVTVDALQTNTFYRFENGRVWGWEGVWCCAGTCTHVWHYAQSPARLFPALERDLRQRTDYGIAFREKDGFMDFRAGAAGRDCTDGQAGVILRTYREHLFSKDDKFLKGVYPRMKKALEFLIAQDARDGEPDGLPFGEQHNTLDAEWYGNVPVLCSLYLAAIRAGQEMARLTGDKAFEKRCGAIHEKGQTSIKRLFDKEAGYFVQIEDPKHLDAIGVGRGCYIDQVFGQSWAFSLGLGRLFDQGLIRAALDSLWKYNFAPDMGRVRASISNPKLRGRPYALQGDAGLVMCTWPFGGRRTDWERHWQYGYFNECMTGFEYEAAAHMIWEGTPEMVERGLAICKAIHDRYDPAKRNPFNEIECSDHYARAMASYGAYLAACGYEYDGPRGHLGFDPRLSKDNFRAAFTAAEGWGSFTQLQTAADWRVLVELKWGSLRLRTLSVRVGAPESVRAWVGQKEIPVKLSHRDGVTTIQMDLVLKAGQTLGIELR